MEARLVATLVPEGPGITAAPAGKVTTGTAPDTKEASPARDGDGADEEAPRLEKNNGHDPATPNFDEMAESAFRAEARDRGETLAPVAAPLPDESGPLPPLGELVERIPANVRETLDELFRAKFVTVRRMPAKALKS